MKQTMIIFLMALVLGTIAHATQEGHETGNGGYFCNGVPCDLYYERHDYKLPYSSDQKVGLKQLPADVIKELELMNHIIAVRSVETIDLLSRWKNIVQIYNTKTFMGEDAHYAGVGAAQRQVGYAYWFNQISPFDKSETKKNYIVELDFDYLQTRPARYQAMIILHEIMHFVPGLDHAVISPLLKTLDALMTIQDEQNQGVKRLLTETEMQTLKDLQSYLAHLGFTKEYRDEWGIHPYGGGLTTFKDLSMTNFIDVSSRVEGVPTDGANYYWENNDVKNAVVTPSVPAKYKKYHKGDQYHASLKMRRFDGDAGSRTEFVVQGGVAPFRRCVDFDDNGQCKSFLSWLPVEAAVRTENGGIRVEKLALSVIHAFIKIKEGGHFEQSCSFTLGKITHEKLRWNFGSLYNVDLSGMDCEFLVNLMSKKRLQIVANMALDFPVSFAILDLGSNPLAGEFSGVTFSPGFGGAAGLRILNRVEAFAIAQAHILDNGDNELSRFSYGVTGKVNLTKGLYVGAEYVHQQYDVSIDEATTSSRERFFGLTLGGRHDFLGPYKKK